jgi:hypothetical protein
VIDVRVFSRCELPQSRDALSADERALLDRLGLSGAREREWIAGRAAVHRTIGHATSVLADDDGAPSRDGWSVSLSHDADWVAVAAARDRRVAIDLCSVVHEARAARILTRLGVCCDDPCRAWAALECALKLRHRGVWQLLDGTLAVSDGRVSGIGSDVVVESIAHDEYRLAWAQELA